ncbi:hypothetical protein CEUSTIGMA_g9111.t1 [Chlamydomonas eustigma]|uniref:Uncharacterized protein n=1 Tax=Chlamydomonas eustigma TaxID=1157962 RepID=A0A250XF55_9CHLO|nr:hypothetical protein CEUSTIGMA_g9111.t1 [Chlamydomonas eustigma]|eukprot:GAX81683.1 hypothetical protein CEUSTIGMA_g9111.t1 [Chlamydomonas eustigma]
MLRDYVATNRSYIAKPARYYNYNYTTRLVTCAPDEPEQTAPAKDLRISKLWINCDRMNKLISSVLTRAYCDSTVFYNSQAGRWMTKPGALGLRVHEIFTSYTGAPGASILRGTSPSSIELNKETSEDVLLTHDLADVNIVIPVSSKKDIDQLVQISSTRRAKSIQPLISLFITEHLNEEDLTAATQLSQLSSSVGFPARCLLKSSWRASAQDSDENLHSSTLSEVTVALADAEAAVITFSDCLQQATEDSLREAVESAFSIDCAGESMMERLALRLPTAELCSCAMRLGVTRFDATSCPNAAAAATTHNLHLSEASGCICDGGGSCSILSTIKLIKSAEDNSLKHSFNARALEEVHGVLLSYLHKK